MTNQGTTNTAKLGPIASAYIDFVMKRMGAGPRPPADPQRDLALADGAGLVDRLTTNNNGHSVGARITAGFRLMAGLDW